LAGVLTVASAGNSADKPYVTGTPAAAPSALSVAQTQVPSAGLQLLSFLGNEIPAVFQPWSVAPSSTLSGPVQYGDGAGGNLLGCDPFAAGSLAGKVVLVDRGACNFTLKIKNIGDAGGIIGIIGLVDTSAPFSGGDGGDRPITIPGYMISQANANVLRANVGATLTLDPENQLPLVGQMVGSSSRGPSMLANLIKPEIGAPGASVSAEVGTGDGTTAFGGTSGAAPMVSGSAALLMEADPDRSPAEIKAALVNTGDTDIDTDPFTGLAPIQRIGGGEVRVDRAARSGAAAWDADTLNAALSFGFVDASADSTLTKTVVVHNYSSNPIDYSITPTFRYANDQSLGAVTPAAPASISVPAGGSTTFDLSLAIDASALAAWNANSGGAGANPGPITNLEFDGYLVLDAAGDDNDIHLPWHVLPRRSADIAVSPGGAQGQYLLSNTGAGAARLEGYTLIGMSDDLPEGAVGAQSPVVDLQFVGVATIPGGCGDDGSLIQFAVNTHERQTHANAPALFEFDLDLNGDGTADYAVFNADFSLATGTFNLSDGRNLTFAQNLATGATSAFFFADHDTNSANTVLTVCASQIGGDAGLLGNPIGVTALAADIYFQGAVTDAIEGITWIPGAERFLGTLNGSLLYTSFIPRTLGAGATGTLEVLDFGETEATELGFLVMTRRGAPEDKEAIAVLADGSVLP
ncbi:MAG TPA: S8 family serine peptidase, partial [Acidimicrobiia bacterium]|nr:S8 family serine peptidase [Acidimicrobiia bacterium]